MAVGAGLSPADAAALDRTQTEWGARLTRSASVAGMEHKPWHRGQGADTRAFARGRRRVNEAAGSSSASRGDGGGSDSSSDDVSDDGGYTAASLVDFTVCRQASAFVGWSASTFARMLARFQALDHGRGWYSWACPESATFYFAPPVSYFAPSTSLLSNPNAYLLLSPGTQRAPRA